MTRFKDTDMQLVIGWVLRTGVFTAICIVFFGGVIYLYRHGQGIADYSSFKGIPAFVKNAEGITHGVLTLRGQAIIQMGIVLLIATPVIRVVFSAIGFILEKDYLYTGITLLVLLIICISTILGYSG